MLDHGALDTGNISEAHAHRHAMRHSAAHVMADAVLKLFPEAKMGIGPPTQDGFYYDFDVARPFTPEDLEQIEALMREAMSGAFPFEREELSRQQAPRIVHGPAIQAGTYRGAGRFGGHLHLPAQRVR